MRKAIALPAIIAAGIARAERERRANVIARPMRNLMDMLRQGEVFELDGRAVMRMPEVDEQFATRAEWCEIAPAIRGWIDCWGWLAPDLRLYHMAVLADRLDADKPLTPRLVEQALIAHADHAYLPNTPALAALFEPHEWVREAMRRAYSLGRQAGAHRAREEIRNALGVKS